MSASKTCPLCQGSGFRATEGGPAHQICECINLDDETDPIHELALSTVHYDEGVRFGTGPEMIGQIKRLRDIIRRRLECDGSNGRYHAGEHLDLTEEMRGAIKAAV